MAEQTASKKPMQAIQQFQLGTVLGSEAQARTTLERLRTAGYEGIELCNFMIHPTPFLVKMITKAAGMPVGNGGKLDWPRIIRESGMAVPSVHQYLNSIEENPEAAAEEAQTFGARYVTLTGMYRFDYTDTDNVKALAERLNKAGDALAQRGITLLYHNHNVEFCRTGDGRQAYDILVTETNPAAVGFEFDSYWATDAGANAVSVMQRLGNRLHLYHINDRGHREKGTAMTPIVKMDSCELGTGCMDLEALVAQARAAGVDAVILESHKNWIDKDPIKSAEVSAEFLKKALA